MMNINEVLADVEQVMLTRQLSPVERFILRSSWLGQDYSEMAQDCAYSTDYLKGTGSQLWHELTEALGKKVTKKNLQIVFNQYQQNFPLQHTAQLQTDTLAQDNFPPTLTRKEIQFPGGCLPLDSPIYINRPGIEERAKAEISQPRCLLRIESPKQMGKSSLLIRILAHAKAIEYKTVYLDFQEADEAIFTSIDKFLRWFCVNISKQLNLNPMLDDYWDEDMGSLVCCKIYFQNYLLKQIDSPIVLALNELNRVFAHQSIASDFLPMLRAWYEFSPLFKTWQKLRIVLAYSTEIDVPLKINHSPFNVGLTIKLPHFTVEQVQDLARRYGLDWWSDRRKTEQLMTMVGGHPYLVNLALYHLHQGEMASSDLLLAAPTQAGIYSNHLRSLLMMLLEEVQLASAMQKVVCAKGSVQLEAVTAHKLESLGLVQLDGHLVKSSCELYRLYFRSQLVEIAQRNRMK